MRELWQRWHDHERAKRVRRVLNGTRDLLQGMFPLWRDQVQTPLSREVVDRFARKMRTIMHAPTTVYAPSRPVVYVNVSDLDKESDDA